MEELFHLFCPAIRFLEMRGDKLLLESKNGISKIILNDRVTGNMFSEEFADELLEKFREAQQLENEIIEFSSLDRIYFSRGPDLEYLQSIPKELAVEQLKKISQKLNQFIFELSLTDKLTILSVNGAAFGGGINIFLPCDIRLTTKKTKIYENFRTFGLPLDLSASILLPKYLGSTNTQKLLLDNELLFGDKAYKIGMFHECFPTKKELENRVEEISGWDTKEKESIKISNKLIYKDRREFLEQLKNENDVLLQQFMKSW